MRQVDVQPQATGDWQAVIMVWVCKLPNKRNENPRSVKVASFALHVMLTLYGRTKTAQGTDHYTAIRYIWYSKEGPGRAAAPLSPLIAVPNVTAHPSTASVPTSY